MRSCLQNFKSMKTAEQWQKEWCDDYVTHEQIAQIRLIQLDAIKYGMTLAAKIVVDPEEMQPITQSEINTGKACECAILTARDNLKEIPK